MTQADSGGVGDQVPPPEPSREPTSDRGAGSRRSAGRPSGVLLVLSLLAIALACVLRVLGLRRQGYWSDELFSIGESSTTIRHLVYKGTTEIHPPLFAAVLWVWLHLGGGSTNPDWVRLLPALCGILAIPACWLGLRQTALRRDARLLLTVATACNGMSLVYGQEVRSYSLLFLASVGLTAATLRLVIPRTPSASPTLRGLAGWGLLASATHLFGALLVVACGLAVVGNFLVARPRHGAAATTGGPRPLKVLRATAVGCIPQALWLAFGATVPGFAGGTSWVAAPRPAAIWSWLTTTFGAGQLHRQTDGYRLGSPWLLVACAIVAAIAVVFRLVGGSRRRVRRTTTAETSDAAERRAAVVLAAMTVVSTLVVFLGAQIVHIWLLRNMIVLVPALTWAVVLGLLHLAGVPGRRLVGVLLVLALAASTLGTWRTIQQPYKDQYAQAIDHVADLRAAEPDLHVVGNIRPWWFIGSHHDAAQASAVLGRITQLRAPGTWLPPASWHDVVWVFPTTSPGAVSQQIIQRMGSGCHQVPLVRVAFVECHR